jgi:hypothetical protein
MGHALRLAASNDEVPPSRRESERSRVLLAASVKNAFGDHAVKIRDVSSTGALIEAALVPPAGSRLLLSRGTISVMGTVVWTGSGKYGLQFHDSVDPAELLIPVVAGKKPGPSQPLKPLFPVPEPPAPPLSKH